jgi:hypothetical protein
VVETCAASDKGCEANGEHGGTATKVEQGFVPSRADLFRNFRENFGV